jgi:hypothetical protein
VSILDSDMSPQMSRKPSRSDIALTCRRLRVSNEFLVACVIAPRRFRCSSVFMKLLLG